ncbi:MAG: hypothetical protein JXB00_11785 [Bacteroidales bacterium]|nr:hypothetical protein [Bacteroidales bacterium]
MLSGFSAIGISLLAFRATPLKNNQAQFSLFPNDSFKMQEVAKKTGIEMTGPFAALIIKSDSDEPGECAGIFRRLSQIDIKINESIGIADIKDSYGVVVCLEHNDCEKAIAALKI